MMIIGIGGAAIPLVVDEKISEVTGMGALEGEAFPEVAATS